MTLLIRPAHLMAAALGLFTIPTSSTASDYLLLQPSLTADLGAFGYGDDRWTVARNGDTPTRLTASVANESGPILSPDGPSIAFAPKHDDTVPASHATAETSVTTTNGASARLPVSRNWRFERRGSVAVMQTRYAPVVYYVPPRPQHILVLAFGYPWDEASDATILAYAKANVKEWVSFAKSNNVLLVAPALGGSNFLDFRTLSGRLVDPDTFVNALVDGPAHAVIPQSKGRFCLHGHSAGAQFAARYVVAHPERLECAILSAPSTYAMPTPSTSWPFGMGSSNDSGQHPAPAATSWESAAADTPIEVIIGSRDTEQRPDAPGQIGKSRLERGRAWASAMQALASAHDRSSRVSFVEIPNVDHNEREMAIAAQHLLHVIYSGRNEAERESMGLATMTRSTVAAMSRQP